MSKILEVISAIRDSHSRTVEVYTRGSCVRFAVILKAIYPDGVILYDVNHAIFELDGLCYDITGLVEKKGHIPLDEYTPAHQTRILALQFPWT